MFNFTRSYFLILLEVIFLCGCSSIQTAPIMDEEINYQRDLVMDISYAENGKWAGPLRITGAGVMPRSSYYKVKVYAPAKADMITLASCHRERKTPDPDSKGGWFKKKYYEFDVNLEDTVDGAENCNFDVGVYEKERGRHGWGFFAIQNLDFYKMAALTKCNGRVKYYNGVSVCQAKEGSIQEYVFDRVVSPSEVIGCEITNILNEKKSSAVWQFLMPPGACELEFYDVDDPLNQIHRASFFGFSSIPIRGVE